MFHNGKALVYHIPRKKINVILVSSIHDDNAIDPASGEETKKEMITFKCALQSYIVSRNIAHFPMVIFIATLNVGVINIQIIYTGNQLESLRRRVYLKSLAHELKIRKLRRRNLKITGIPSSLKRYSPIDDWEKSSLLPPI